MKWLSPIIWGGLTVSVLLQQYTISMQQRSLDFQRQSIQNLLTVTENTLARLDRVEARAPVAARALQPTITALAYDGARQTWVPVADPSCQTHRRQPDDTVQVVWHNGNIVQAVPLVTSAITQPGGEVPLAAGTMWHATGTGTVVVVGGQ